MKDIQNIKTIGVIGAGTMGIGIGQVSATSGFKTIIYDTNQEAISKCEAIIQNNLNKAKELGKLDEIGYQNAINNLEFTTDISQIIVDVVIEAVVEKLSVKHEIFNVLAEQNDGNCILATNTSSIPITQIAFGVPNPSRVVGMHFFNPAHIMKLVEVILGAQTSKDVSQTIYDLALKMGKKPVMCKDSAGFIVNRVARHYYVESLKILEENASNVEDIDALLEARGFKMGAFKLMDLIGVDTNFSVTSSMYEQFYFDAKFRPSRIQKQKVDAGFWGKKSGKGFYIYS